MRNFVISLKDAQERRHHICEQFNNKKISFEFFDAITPTENISVSCKLMIDIKRADLTDVEISCFLSHYSIWKKMLKENIDYLGIFEDDIYLSDDASTYLNDHSWLPLDTDIVKLENFFNVIKVTKKTIQLNNSRKLLRLAGCNLGTAGYIISNKGARILVEKFNKLEFFGAIDTEIFDKFIKDNKYKVYQISPALCIQDFNLNKSSEKFNSHIEPDRKIRINNMKCYKKNKMKVNFLKKLRRETLRLSLQFLNIFKKLNTRQVEIDFQ